MFSTLFMCRLGCVLVRVCMVYRYCTHAVVLTLTGLYVMVWCTVCLFGVPFTFCHGRTRIDDSSSCLYAVPLVYARIVLTLPGFIVIVWCTVCLVGVPFMFCLVLTLIGLILSVRCTVSVRTRSYLHWRVLLLFVWCTVSVRTRSYSHG